MTYSYQHACFLLAINKETLDLFGTIHFCIKQQDFIQRTDSHK